MVQLSQNIFEPTTYSTFYNRLGNTPLHTAYHTTHRNIANMLIELGANPNARNLSGLRPQDLGKRR